MTERSLYDGPCTCGCHDRSGVIHIVPCCAYTYVPRAKAQAQAEALRAARGEAPESPQATGPSRLGFTPEGLRTHNRLLSAQPVGNDAPPWSLVLLEGQEFNLIELLLIIGGAGVRVHRIAAVDSRKEAHLRITRDFIPALRIELECEATAKDLITLLQGTEFTSALIVPLN